MNGIAYTRCSTDEQANSGLGLDAQRRQIESYAAANGIDIAGWHCDAGVSGGKSIDKREGLMAALTAVPKGGVLIVAKRDRLARDTLLACWIEKELKKKNASVISAAGEGSGDDDEPSMFLLRRITDVFAEYEVRMIRWRTKLALRAKRNRGERSGRIRYGYCAGEGKSVIPCPGEQIILGHIISRNQDGDSYRAIARSLNDAGVPSKMGKRWDASSVISVLRTSAS